MSPRETSSPTRGEERRARVRSGATAGVTTVIRTLFPCPPIRFPGSLVYLLHPSMRSFLRTASTARFHGNNRTSGSDVVPNFRPNVIVAQCLIGVKMALVEICFSCTRAGRVCNCGREASSDSRSRAPNRPSVEG